MSIKNRLLFMFLICPGALWAQAVEMKDLDQTPVAPVEKKVDVTPQKERVGEAAARKKYFDSRKAEAPDRTVASEGGGSRYMSLQIGTFISQDTYKWGGPGNKNPGQLNLGVGYKIGEWSHSMDLLFKADLTTYRLDEGQALKLSFLPAIVFPDSSSGFPLYFGGGAGLGVFLKQIPDESSFAFEYSVFAGARFFDIWKGVGLAVETGIKNHILLLSDGQFNGVFFNLGMVFQF